MDAGEILIGAPRSATRAHGVDPDGKQARGFDKRSRRPLVAQFEAPRKPPQPSAPFYFVLLRAFSLNVDKLAVINRLMRIVPHHGIAFHSLLVQNGLIAAERREGFGCKQTRRHLVGDTSVCVFDFVC